jgi:hypothetical protein
MNQPDVSPLHLTPDSYGKPRDNIAMDNIRPFLVQNSREPPSGLTIPSVPHVPQKPGARTWLATTAEWPIPVVHWQTVNLDTIQSLNGFV